jgi:hypothetical protein
MPLGAWLERGTDLDVSSFYEKQSINTEIYFAKKVTLVDEYNNSRLPTSNAINAEEEADIEAILRILLRFSNLLGTLRGA